MKIYNFHLKPLLTYGMITNDVSDCINLFVRIAHIICNHPSYELQLTTRKLIYIYECNICIIRFLRVIITRKKRWEGHVARRRQIHTKHLSEVAKEGDPLGYLGIDVRVSEWISKRWEGVGWIHVAQDKDQWRALVRTVMKL